MKKVFELVNNYDNNSIICIASNSMKGGQWTNNRDIYIPSLRIIDSLQGHLKEITLNGKEALLELKKAIDSALNQDELKLEEMKREQDGNS